MENRKRPKKGNSLPPSIALSTSEEDDGEKMIYLKRKTPEEWDGSPKKLNGFLCDLIRHFAAH